MDKIHVIFQNDSGNSYFDSSGRNLVILGINSQGPSLTPVYANDPTVVENLFGARTPLTNAFNEAYTAGASSVYLMRINGNPATFSFIDSNGNTLLDMKTINGGSIYNTETGELSTKVEFTTLNNDSWLTIISSDGTTRSYSLTRYSTIGMLVNAINYDAECNLIEFLAESFNTFDDSDILLDSSIVFTDGDDEPILGSNQLYARLDQCYSILESFPVDIIYPLDVYFDDDFIDTPYIPATPLILTMRHYAIQLAKFCAKKESFSNGVVGILKVRPFATINDVTIQNSIDTLIQRTLWATTYQSLVADIDLGKYLSVVVGEIFYNGIGQESFAASYAGLLNSLPYYVSPTNKTMTIDGELAVKLTDNQITSLVEKKFTTLYKSIRRGIVPTQCLTMASLETGYSSIVHLNISNEIARYVREVFEIDGECDSYPYNRLLNEQEELEEKLDAMLGSSLMNYSVTTELVDPRSPQITVDFVAYGEIGKITVSPRLKN